MKLLTCSYRNTKYFFCQISTDVLFMIKNTSTYSQLSAAILLWMLHKVWRDLLVNVLCSLKQNISDILKG